MQPAAALAGFIWTVSSCVAAGALLVRLGPSGLSRGEWLALSFLTGAAAVSLLVFAMSLAGLADPAVFATIGLLLLAGAIQYGRPEFDEPRPPRLFWWAFVPLAAFGLIYFLNALAPEASPDGSGYHLGLVRRYLDAHRMFSIPTNMYASLPQGVEMLFLYAYAIGRHSAAALVHLAFLPALACLVYEFGRRAGHAEAGAAAAVLLACSPVVGIDAASAYNDVALTACLFGAFFLVWGRKAHSVRGSETGVMTLAGLLTGFALAIKYTAAAFAAVVLIWVLHRALLGRTRNAALGFAAAAGLMITPWLVRNTIWLENPVAPFFNRWFPNAHMHVSVEEDYRRAMRTYNGAALDAAWPREVTLSGAKLQGIVGPVFLLAPLGLLAIRRPEGRAVLAGAAAALLIYPANLGTRFLIPALPFVALAILLALPAAKITAPLVALAAAVACWPHAVDLYAETAWRIREVPWRAALRLEPEERYLAARLDPGYSITRMIEERTPPNAKIYTALPLPEAYTSRNILLDYAGALNVTLSETLQALVPNGQGPRADGLAVTGPARTWKWGLEGLEADAIRLRPPRNSTGGWRIYELRVVARRASGLADFLADLRVTAEPNPFQAALAADGNPATFWSPWRRDQQDSYWQVELPPDRELTGIEARLHTEGSAPRLEARWGNKWSLVAVEPQVQMLESLPGKFASEYLVRNGVSHVLLHEDEPLYPQIAGHEWELGWSEIGRSGPGILYEIHPQEVDLRARSRNNRR
jgi:hypothetical protein